LTEQPTKILLLDSNSLINRAFHALPPMQTKDGLFTNAVYGYISMLHKLIEEEKPTHVCAVFDCKAKTFRHLRYELYKANRKPMPEELAMQVPVLKDLLQRMGIKILFQEGIEADDILGTLAKRYPFPTIIVSGDRDVLQLVDDTTTVFHTKRGVTDIKKYTPSALAEENLTPEQIIEYKALAGDASDNIPGAQGVGEKTAKDLLSKYTDVDTLYEHLDEIKGKLREHLEQDKENVYLSRELATIETHADVPCELDDLVFSLPLPDEAKELMTKLEFKNLTNRFQFAEEKPIVSEKVVSVETVSIDTISDAETELKRIPKGETVCVLLEENVSVSYRQRTIILRLAEGLLGEGIPTDDAVELVKPFFGKEYTTVFFDAKKDMHRFRYCGIVPQQPYDDILLMAYLVNNTKVIKDREGLLSDYGYENKNPSAEMLDLRKTLSEKLREKNLDRLYREIELPLIEVLFSMEKEGFLIDTTMLGELGENFSKEINELIDKIHIEAEDKDFNINSNKQLSEILFDKLGLKPPKKNKTGYSVSAEVLEELEHPIIDLLLRYRQLTKLKSTYVDGMRNVMNLATHKVHTEFKQCLTTTGRLSSIEPNLQNIPVRTEEGREIRKMFIPQAGNILISADYSQIELRLLAHFSEEPNLIDSYQNGIDIHALTASKIFRTPLEEVDSSMRRSAKAVNFGIIYGISGFGLAKNAGVTTKQAKVFIDEYFATYPKVKEYMEKNKELAKQQGFLTTLAGRIRYFPELTSSQFTIRSFGERAAMNFPLQGTASDIIKIAMLKVFRALQSNGLQAKIILQVHDELIIECPESEEERVKAIVKEEMTQAVSLRVPLEIGISSGRNWYDAK